MSDSLSRTFNEKNTHTQQAPLIVVPVYNHAATLNKVLEDLSRLKLPILVVDDGSTDAIDAALDLHPSVECIRHSHNLGKGAAIASGMRAAQAKGYKAIMTFDADGQHLAHDVPKLLDAHFERPDSLIIGARDFRSAESGDIPGSSKFGRSFSNFWVWLETGHWLDDTQTGLRIYPNHKGWLHSIKGRRYSFEVEAITRFLWQGGKAHCVPIGVFYPKRDVRISHFHAIHDNYLLTRTHTRLVVLRVLGLLRLYRSTPMHAKDRPEVKGMGLSRMIIKRFGTGIAYALMIFPVLCIFLSRGFERRALDAFYQKARPSWGHFKRLKAGFKNYLQFAASIIDRTNPNGMTLVNSKAVRTEGRALSDAFPQGAILLGAHYGDWALIASRVKPYLKGSLGLVLDPQSTPQFFFELEKKLNGRLRMIDANQDPLGFALSVKEVLDENGNVAFLADRSPRRDKPAETLSTPFLGELAHFPKGPFAISARLRSPVVFVSATKENLKPSGTYEVAFEMLWDGVEKIREEELLRRYVLALEKKVKAAPHHWFNFYPFW